MQDYYPFSVAVWDEEKQIFILTITTNYDAAGRICARLRARGKSVVRVMGDTLPADMG